MEELKKFAYWNEALEGKEYNLKEENEELYRVHVQKCGVCGSCSPA